MWYLQGSSYHTDLLGVLESVKAAADISTPIRGTVAEVNTALTDSPELINEDSYKLGKSGQAQNTARFEPSWFVDFLFYNPYCETSEFPRSSEMWDRNRIAVVEGLAA